MFLGVLPNHSGRMRWPFMCSIGAGFLAIHRSCSGLMPSVWYKTAVYTQKRPLQWTDAGLARLRTRCANPPMCLPALALFRRQRIFRFDRLADLPDLKLNLV